MRPKLQLSHLPARRGFGVGGGVLLAVHVSPLLIRPLGDLLAGEPSRVPSVAVFGTAFLLPLLLAGAFAAGVDTPLAGVVAVVFALFPATIALLELPGSFGPACAGMLCESPDPWTLAWWGTLWVWNVGVILGSLGLLVAGASQLAGWIGRRSDSSPA